MSDNLNRRAGALAALSREARPEGISEFYTGNGARIFDCGIQTGGGLQAGAWLSRLCLSQFGTVHLQTGPLAGAGWTYVAVQTDQPLEACLLSQYAGWKIHVGDYFAMGSGPMRAAAGVETLFESLNYHESSATVVGVLETGRLPDDTVTEHIASSCNVNPEAVTLAVAPTSSLSGTFQVVARSVETSMHKLFELGFDVHRVRSGYGTAPLPPVAGDDLTAIGLTNDAILYGSEVTLWVTGDDDSLADIVTRVPSDSSTCYGQPFLDIFREADHDFYRIDPLLFSPATVTLQNLETGQVHRAGQVNERVLRSSFGI